MPHGSVSAVEIDRKLNQDFRRRLKDYGISAEATDPVLAVIFRTFAQEIERLYLETGRIRTSLLDEFLTGLHIEPRKAHPAQSIIRFFPNSGTTVLVPGGTELEAIASTGERLTFITDASVRVSTARIGNFLLSGFTVRVLAMVAFACSNGWSRSRARRRNLSRRKFRNCRMAFFPTGFLYCPLCLRTSALPASAQEAHVKRSRVFLDAKPRVRLRRREPGFVFLCRRGCLPCIPDLLV